MGLLGGIAGAIVTSNPVLAQDNPAIAFRTKSYRVQIFWRGNQPLMTVSHNASVVLNNCRARTSASRGAADTWTTYTCSSGDYQAIVRLGAGGEAAIAVTLSGARLTEEYATFPVRKPPQPTSLKDGTVLAFETKDYAVNVYRQKGELWMNLYNKKSATTELKQVPVKLTNTTGGSVYQHEGEATVQARENVRGERSLYILQDNQIKYRAEGY